MRFKALSYMQYYNVIAYRLTFKAKDIEGHKKERKHFSNKGLPFLYHSYSWIINYHEWNSKNLFCEMKLDICYLYSENCKNSTSGWLCKFNSVLLDLLLVAPWEIFFSVQTFWTTTSVRKSSVTFIFAVWQEVLYFLKFYDLVIPQIQCSFTIIPSALYVVWGWEINSCKKCSLGHLLLLKKFATSLQKIVKTNPSKLKKYLGPISDQYHLVFYYRLSKSLTFTTTVGR